MFDAHDDREVLVAQIDSLRDFNRSQASVIAEMKNAELFLLGELRRRERELEMIQSSRTWKISRIILGPALLLRALYRRVVGHH